MKKLYEKHEMKLRVGSAIMAFILLMFGILYAGLHDDRLSGEYLVKGLICLFLSCLAAVFAIYGDNPPDAW